MLSKILEELNYVKATTQPDRIRITYDHRIVNEIVSKGTGYAIIPFDYVAPKELFGIKAFYVKQIDNDDGYEISIVI